MRIIQVNSVACLYIYIVQLVNNAISPQPICKQEELELCPPHREIIVPVSGCPVAGTESITPYGIITVAVPMSFIGKNLEFFFSKQFFTILRIPVESCYFSWIRFSWIFLAILSIFYFTKSSRYFTITVYIQSTNVLKDILKRL